MEKKSGKWSSGKTERTRETRPNGKLLQGDQTSTNAKYMHKPYADCAIVLLGAVYTL